MVCSPSCGCCRGGGTGDEDAGGDNGGVGEGVGGGNDEDGERSLIGDASRGETEDSLGAGDYGGGSISSACTTCDDT